MATGLARPEPSLAKKEVAVAAETMLRASEYAFRLELSALRWQVNPNGHFDGLSNVLEVYADRLKRFASSAGLRDPVEENLVRASIARHVEERTGRWYDEDVAWLVEIVTEEECSTEGHVKWRQRHKELLARPTPMEQSWERNVERRRHEAARLRQTSRRYVPIALSAARMLYPERFSLSR
jgi:hypothetical protein